MDTLPSGTIKITNPEQGVWSDRDAWRLVEDLRIGGLDGPGPDVFGEIGGFAVDGAGRIYVLDRQAREIRVFDAEGRFIYQIGRAGQGPGELGAPTGLAVSGDRLWLVDPGNGRYTVYDTTGTVLATHPRPIFASIFPWFGGIDAGGRLLDMSSQPRSLIRYGEDGQPADTIPLPSSEVRPPTFPFVDAAGEPRGFRFVPFTPRFRMAFDPARGIWFGLPSEYRFGLRSFEGDTVRIVERGYRPVAVSAAELSEELARLEEFEREGGRVDRSLIPAEKPAYEAIFIADDSHIWISPGAAPEDAGRVFDVFDPEGRYLGRVRSDVALGTSLSPIVVRGALYALTQDELDVPYLVRSQIIR